MKAHNVRHVVLSPGGRNIPINHCLEQDEFLPAILLWMSVVQHTLRSASLSSLEMKSWESAVRHPSRQSNYTPGITEAFYLRVPLLVITADRNPNMLEQMENQMINQVDMFRNFCKNV